MVRLNRLPAFLSLTALVTFFLASSVESAEEKMPCKQSFKTKVYPNSNPTRAIVILKSGDLNAKAGSHKKWLEDCWNIKTVRFDSKGISPKSTTNAFDFSVDGGLNGYHLTGSPQFFKEQIGTRNDVEFIELEQSVKINYAVPSNEIFKRTVEKNTLENLDRIDQLKFPLDKSFTFPNSAGKGVNIFIVDTGVDIKHEQFENRAKIGGSFCDTAGCNTNRDDHGHGTHVAGTAAGKTVGVARKANIIAVKVLDANGSGSNVGVVKGLQFVLAQHKKNKNKNSVVNMSLGGSVSEAINKAVASLTKNGIHVAVAAGNEGQDACNASPASERSAITVAALENTADKLTDFSNVGKCVDIIAPGRLVKSARANTRNQFTIFSGTSQATPHVAGTVALIIGKGGNRSPAEMIKELIKLSSKNVVNKSTLRGTPNNVLKVPAQ